MPLGLTTAPPFTIRPRGRNPGPIIQEADIMPPPESVIEEETRRNIFWLGEGFAASFPFFFPRLVVTCDILRVCSAYTAERQQAASSNFALELDDQDICQLLPVRGDQFDLGVRRFYLSRTYRPLLCSFSRTLD